jgi:hypothetical protein
LDVDRLLVRERYLALRSGLPAPDVCAHVREVVILASSSRGGSSIFAEVLRRVPGLVHLRAEMNPPLRLFGCAGVESDAVPADHPVPAGLSSALGADCGRPTASIPASAVPAFAAEIAARLVLQWPELPVTLSPVLADVEATLAELRASGWPPERFVDPGAFYAALFRRLRARWPSFRPAAYDMDRARLVQLEPTGPFLPVAPIEEPPFVLPLPWEHATEAELERLPLVIKTPGNAYRLDWLARLFPRARVRILHLTRNPAASINGLVDGWCYPGFHSHDAGGLAIAGYSDQVPGGERWWKFDRPPGWEAFRSVPLSQVCAFQWASAHRAILAHDSPDRFVLRFEDVLGPTERQTVAMRRLSAWLGLPGGDELVGVLGRGLPLVMATEAPRHRRWFARIGTLEPLCATSLVSETRAALGYADDPAEWE